jgi:molybdate transport system ATP-binding protein
MKPRGTARPFLTLTNAAFRLGDRLVFRDSSWNFLADEHWAIMGANGSGKSLLADAIRGKLPLLQGELRYGFKPAPELSPEECIGHVAFEERKAEVHGRVLQSRWNSFEVEHELTVKEHLSFERVMEVNPFEIHPRLAESKRQFEARRSRAIRWMEIGGLLERKAISLSNGETQKVQIAKALCRPIRLLILDEPFASLDSASRKRLAALLSRLMKGQLRVLFLAAREEELPRGITHLLRVEDCRIVQLGAVNHTKRKSKSESRTKRKINKEGERGKALVSMRDVMVRYGKTVILRDVNWIVRDGESWALLGPNGSGKTTLLSLITGDHPQVYANEVTVFGRRRGTGESMWDLRKRIGSVSPELQVHFDDRMTCLEVVESGFNDTVGLFENPSAGQRRVARSWLRRFDLLKFDDEPLFALSAGLSRMVLLARALVKKPRLLIMDEPCQGLDEAHRDLFLRILDQLLREQAMTAIYVTHREEELPREIKHVLELKGGRAWQL